MVSLQRGVALFAVSVSNTGDCWDNAVAERFFTALKTESLHHLKFKTRDAAHLEMISDLSEHSVVSTHSSIAY